jgi:hypothetical protein
MTDPPGIAIWTGLLAGAVAHDINNFVQGVSSARALASAPGLTSTEAAETAAIIEDDLEHLRKLGSRLRGLAGAGARAASTLLADACADALVEVDLLPEPTGAASIPPDLLVAGTAAAVTTALASLLEYARATGPSAARVRVTVRGSQSTGAAAAGPARPSPGSPLVVEIAAPEAEELGAVGETRLDVLLTSSFPELRGDARLILAGAIADALGGAVYVASGPEIGLVLALHLVTG